MKRFFKGIEEIGGLVQIRDRFNTEIIGTIFLDARYGLDSPVDLIIDLLNKHFGDIETDKCDCGKDKPKEFVHCGCQYMPLEPGLKLPKNKNN